MTTYKLLEQKLSDRFYIKIESQFPSQLFAGQGISVLLTESLSAASPIMSVKLMDSVGALVSAAYMSPEVIYTTTFGLDDHNARTAQFSLSTEKGQNVSQGTIENVGMDINFLSNNWPKLISQTHSRSWTQVRYSDVVTQIATECGLSTTDIEQTDQILNVIQPGWTNYQMLCWIAEHARSSTGNVGFDMAVRFDNTFSFKTYNSFFNVPPKYNLYLKGRKMTNRNIYNIDFRHDYAPTMSRAGGFGVHTMYFDYNKKQFVASDMDITKTNQAQLSDWYFIPTAHLNPVQRLYMARDTNAKITAEHNLASASNSVQSVQFSILGDANLHIGDLVNLVLYNSEQLKSPINEIYSGYWLVSKVTQIIDFPTSGFTTDLTLVRSGFNGTAITNFAKSAKGKLNIPMAPSTGNTI